MEIIRKYRERRRELCIDTFSLKFNPATTKLGQNGVGRLEALTIFFKNTEKRQVSHPLLVTASFSISTSKLSTAFSVYVFTFQGGREIKNNRKAQ